MDLDRVCNKICVVDSKKLLTVNGLTTICERYGSVKNVTLWKHQKDNKSYIEFEDPHSAYKIFDDKPNLPNYLTVDLIYNQNNEDDEDSEVVENPETIDIADEIKSRGEPIYLGPDISVSSVIEESKRLKLNDKTISYNLDNDNLFGKPLSSKWEKFEKSNFELHNLSYYKRFENCVGGQIKVEKKLGPNVFTGWITNFDDGENVKDILKSMSDDIENSDVLNIEYLKRGMLVGAFDSVTNLYGRGYVALVAGNSVNVVMSDYGRVINTTKIRKLPEEHTQYPAYAFKVYTKDHYVPQLKEKPFNFKVHYVSSVRIVLIIFDENKEIKVQLKNWQPTVEESGVPYIDFKSGSFVELLKLKDMNSAYLRSKEKHHFEFFFAMWNSVALYCHKTPQFLNREPLYGEIIGFKSTMSNMYARGRIHKYLGDKIYCVKHMDNPFKENIKLSEMIELQFEHKSMPVSFIKVGLKDALPYPIQFEAKQFIGHMIGIRLIVKFEESKFDGWNNVDLTIAIVKESFNNILSNLVEPSWLKTTENDQRLEFASDCFTYQNILSNTLEENSVVNMKFVMYYDGVFYMRDKIIGKSFTPLLDMIEEYCSLNLHPYLPHNDEICLGRFPDGFWHRIICDELKPGQLAKVYSVDFGNVAYLDSKNMRKLKEELLFHPSPVYRCILDGIKPINASKLGLLDKYQNTDCEFTVIKNLGDKNHYLIKCPLFEDILE